MIVIAGYAALAKDAGGDAVPPLTSPVVQVTKLAALGGATVRMD